MTFDNFKNIGFTFNHLILNKFNFYKFNTINKEVGDGMSLKSWIYDKSPDLLLPLFSLPYWGFHPHRDLIREAAVYAGGKGWFGSSEFEIVDLPFGGKLKGKGLIWAMVGKKYEPGTSNLLLRKLREGMVFVDVGANIG